MSLRPLRVLTLSDLYPRPRYLAHGIYVEQQTQHLKALCDPVVVAPVRVFPPTSVFKQIRNLSRFKQAWQKWREDLSLVPKFEEKRGIPVYYPRYTSLPNQVLHASWGWFAYGATAALLKRLHRAEPFDLIHAHFASPGGVMGLLAKRWMKVPVALSVHGMDLAVTAAQNAAGAAIVRYVFQNVDAIFANSRRTASEIIRYGADPNKVHVVYLGTDGHQPPPVRATTAPRPLNLLTVSHLWLSKGVDLVLHSLRQLLDEGFDLTYTIVGDGDYRAALEKLVRDLQLTPYVTFAGYTPHHGVWEYFAKCDVYVQPSWVEAFGLVYLEALSQGKAVIGCDTSGANDIAQLYRDGVELVQPRNQDDVTNALRVLIQDADRRQRVSQNGPRFIQERFSWQRTARETMLVYQQLLETRTVPTVSDGNRQGTLP